MTQIVPICQSPRVAEQEACSVSGIQVFEYRGSSGRALLSLQKRLLGPLKGYHPQPRVASWRMQREEWAGTDLAGPVQNENVEPSFTKQKKSAFLFAI